jgi:hypothetical protein
MDQKTNQPIICLDEQDKPLLIARFDRSFYQITEPDPTWFQRSFGDPPECSKCGDTLTFCFPPRIDPQIAGFAGSYQTPVAIRCNCFLTEPASAEPASVEVASSVGFVCHRGLARQPVAIVPF